MKDVLEIRPTGEPWVSAEKVAEHLGRFTPDHIRVMARRGQLPARNMGFGKKKYWVFRLSEVDAAVERSVAS